MSEFPREQSQRNESQPLILFLLFQHQGRAQRRRRRGTLKGTCLPIAPECSRSDPSSPLHEVPGPRSLRLSVARESLATLRKHIT